MEPPRRVRADGWASVQLSPMESIRTRPMGRMADPAEIAAAAIFLASRAGDYVVGSTLIVDGGVAHTRGGS